MYELVKMQYRLRKITSAQVWACADTGKITPQQAVLICGPRPEK